MDHILEGWSKLSLLDKEGERVKLERKQQSSVSNNVVLAAKFLNKRVLNVDAISRTFRAIWRTRKNFNIQQDAERVLNNEQWSFDKHLVLFRRLEGSRNIRSLQFTSTKFWVQLHGLPVDRLDIPTAIQIGKTIGATLSFRCEAEMIAGDFLRIRVEVDVLKPLCRGRKVVLDNEKEVSVAFRYEKLPNFCYWCGMVCHDDKDCDLWLSSKGSLPLES